MPLRVIFYEERFKRAQEAKGSNPLKIEGGAPPISRAASPVSRAASLALHSYTPFIQDSFFFPLEMFPLSCAVSIAMSRECVSPFKESTPQPPPAALVRVRVRTHVYRRGCVGVGVGVHAPLYRGLCVLVHVIYKGREGLEGSRGRFRWH